jgi:dTDP-4-dehydrorhamnose reductase
VCFPMQFQNARIALVGGRGFVGDKLSSYLEQQKCIHCVLDMAPEKEESKHYQYRKDYCINLCRADDIYTAFEEFRPTLVIHLASYGMSGKCSIFFFRSERLNSAA